MQTRAIIFFLSLSCAALLAACGGSAPGDPVSGRKLFRGETLIANGNGQKCSACHADTPEGESPLGPNLSNIGSRAGVTVKDQPADEYLRDSILRPDTYLAGGYQEGIHPRNYAQVLNDQQVSDLVAYMATLKSGKN